MSNTERKLIVALEALNRIATDKSSCAIEIAFSALVVINALGE